MGGFLFDFSLSHIKITTEYKGKQMSNVYLDNNRIMKMKDVDKKLKKIGTWRDIDTDVKLAVFSIIFLLASSFFVVGYMRNAKENFKQELAQELAKNIKQTDSVHTTYIDNKLSKQH